ncbi:MAG: 4-(cytidine 5'-diphospho)-2-C-methyl-D-erythritol kinase [Sphingobacteriia bacterium]|nr:4-(cytidine 5'-diphospho)-2-C-methyl-D-erythritol kinase [Sphingobacteriia bacterium]
METRLVAPAKINLSLNITGKRKNGYHELHSIVVFGVVSDEIIILPSNKNELKVEGQFAYQISDENIITKCLNLAKKKGAEITPYNITLKKNIPVGAGLGGGTADAGAILRYISSAYKQIFSHEEMASIGADVPMCFTNSPLIAEGIGEKITPIQLGFKLYIMLINPGIYISTQKMYDLIKDFNKIETKMDIDNLEMLVNYLKVYGNDFLNIDNSNIKEIKRIIKDIEALPGCVYASMTGSGSTCFGIFKNLEDLENSYLQFTKNFPQYWCKKGVI